MRFNVVKPQGQKRGAGAQSGMQTGGTRTKRHMDRDMVGMCAQWRSVLVVTKLPALARDALFATFQHRE